LQSGKLRAAINVASYHRPAGSVRVIKNRIDARRIRRRCRRGRGESRILNEAFAIAPSVVLATTGIGRLLNINLLARVLPHITDKHPTGRSIETVAERITQAEQPDFLFQGRRSKERIVRRNRVRADRWIDMDPQHLAEQRRVILRVAAGLDVANSTILIVARAAVAGGDVEIVIVARARTKSDPAAV